MATSMQEQTPIASSTYHPNTWMNECPLAFSKRQYCIPSKKKKKKPQKTKKTSIKRDYSKFNTAISFKIKEFCASKENNLKGKVERQK